MVMYRNSLVCGHLLLCSKFPIYNNRLLFLKVEEEVLGEGGHPHNANESVHTDWCLTLWDSYKWKSDCAHFLSVLGDGWNVAEEEQVPCSGLQILFDLDLLVWDQLCIFKNQAQDDWTQAHSDRPGRVLSESQQGSGQATFTPDWISLTWKPKGSEQSSFMKGLAATLLIFTLLCLINRNTA